MTDNYPLRSIEYDYEFRQSISSLLTELSKINNDNIESQLILVDYNVTRIKERAKALLKQYNKNMEDLNK